MPGVRPPEGYSFGTSDYPITGKNVGKDRSKKWVPPDELSAADLERLPETLRPKSPEELLAESDEDEETHRQMDVRGAQSDVENEQMIRRAAELGWSPRKVEPGCVHKVERKERVQLSSFPQTEGMGVARVLKQDHSVVGGRKRNVPTRETREMKSPDGKVTSVVEGWKKGKRYGDRYKDERRGRGPDVY
jgi:hypothetical protein